MACVYFLVSSREPDVVRYVGISKYDTPDVRLKAHIRNAAHESQLPVHCWIRETLSNGYTVVALAHLTELTWQEAGRQERALIGEMRETTSLLLNVAKGGHGGNGVASPETRKKISDALKGRSHSQEHRAKLSAALTGHTPSSEHRRKISEALKGRPGHPWGVERSITDEQRQKMREGVERRQHRL